MTRALTFIAGLAAGIAATLVGERLAFPDAEAAPRLQTPQPRIDRPEVKRPQASEQPQSDFLEQRCTPGFRHSPDDRGRYTCNRVAAVRCARGVRPANVQLYRPGNAAGPARLTYECRMSETVRTHCGRGYVPRNLKLYRAGNRAGGSRLLYECVTYRPGNR